MEEHNKETLDLSKCDLKKLEKATPDEAKNVITLILDQNELQKLDNIETYTRVENLSICNNFVIRMLGMSHLTNIRVLSLNNNGIIQIEGLKEMTYLKVLKLAGNSIKSIEHLHNNKHLEHIDLSNNQIVYISDISYLKHLKHLNLERNRIIELGQCDRYLPNSIEHLGLAHNKIQDLNDVSHLMHLKKLESFTILGNPCVAMAGKDKLGFDYRPFIVNWIMSVKTLDGYIVSAIETLKAEWLYSQGKGRHFSSGQHQELCEYLASSCPLTADALETEDQKKLRLILSKAQHHQQQLKDQTGSPQRSRIQSPRLQSRISRPLGRSPDRLSSSFHSGVTADRHDSKMSNSYDERALRNTMNSPAKKGQAQESHRSNQPLESASKMVPVPESLMSPDYQEPLFDAHKIKCLSSNSSITSLSERSRRPKSNTSSPRMRVKTEKKEVKQMNGTNGEVSDDPKRRKKTEMAAVTIQKMWRGYKSRNLNKDTLRILHAIQAARARQHIQKLTSDMEATKAGLESERKIQQLQMQAINALWKKVSLIQDNNKTKTSTCENNADKLKELTDTCLFLQNQLVQLQGSMKEVLRAVSHVKANSEPVATQTDISAVITPQEERSTWLKRPQTLLLNNASAPLDMTTQHIPETPLIPQSEFAPVNNNESPNNEDKSSNGITVAESSVK